MKLYNCVLQFDVYIVANNAQEAIDACTGIIQRGEPPTDKVTYDIRTLRDIRVDWRDQQPFVAPSVTDEQYAPLADLTTESVFNALSGPGLESQPKKGRAAKAKEG
jgi:hypothetical protein